MRLLLDTHALLWWTVDDPRLSSRARDAVQDVRNEVYVSAATVWEISIKAALGRLELPADHDSLWIAELRSNGFRPLPVGIAHAVGVRDLPLHHRDPFDRLLVVQALFEGLTLVSDDQALQAYAVPLLW